ncbi:C-type lectin domain-containing protein [Podarcis lilfordi]|uniref:C-type lectin domain-containing protein n=1 Tax=Podarcis lilfordi TaxID=74358 RepID=A0AA35PCX4_9SAUR|nr:C-type lectin domain-containing protein [Podarcis lilfordi]
MSQDVTYADLRFGKVPLEKIQRQETTEEELTYENVQGARPEEEKAPSSLEPAKGPRRQTYYAAVALLAVSLFFFATTVGFVVGYWQVSRQLGEASQAHAANSSALAQRLKRAGEELRRAQSNLTLLHQDHGRLEEKNREMETNLTHARSCQQIGCCPPQWKLFRWKCLWVSTEKRTWAESKTDCVKKESLLLVLRDPWSAEELQRSQVLMNSLRSTPFWIGLRGVREWVDNSHYSGPLKHKPNKDCVQVSQEGLKQESCGRKSLYICQKIARSSPWS